MICELAGIKVCNDDAVLDKEECNAVVSWISTIFFVTAVSSMELYNLFIIYMFVDIESELRW